jgi:hypothetical protein
MNGNALNSRLTRFWVGGGPCRASCSATDAEALDLRPGEVCKLKRPPRLPRPRRPREGFKSVDAASCVRRKSLPKEREEASMS